MEPHIDLGEIRDFASLVFVMVFPNPPPGVLAGKRIEGARNHIPRGYVLVTDRKFRDPKWKLPGGHGLPGEIPVETARRELEGETGICTNLVQFRYLGKWLGPRGDHWKILFVASIGEDERDWLGQHHSENEGEEPRFFTIDEFWQMVRQGGVLPDHYHMLVESLLIIPSGRDKVPA